MIQLLPHVQVAARASRRKRQDGRSDLRILQLTDMHLFPAEDEGWVVLAKGGRYVDFERDGYDPGNKRAVELVTTLINRDRPDLVIFTGDIIDGRPFGEKSYEGGDEEARRAWVECFSAVIAPLLACDPPVLWTFCPGNHDDDHSPWTRQDLLEIFSLPGCATPKAESFNFTFTIGTKPSAGEVVQGEGDGAKFRCFASGETLLRLWVFDSGGNNKEIRYDPFPADVVKEFTQLTTWPSDPMMAISNGSPSPFDIDDPPGTPGLAFFHIPLPEYTDAMPIVGSNNLFNAALSSGGVPSPYKYVPWLVRCLGKDRIAGCSKVNSGMFEALQKSQAHPVKACFVGHDHYSDYVASRGNTYLCYGRVSSYTPPSNFEGDGGTLPFCSGARVVQAIGGGDVDAAGQKCHRVVTWIENMDRIEEGSMLVLDGSHHTSRNKRDSWCSQLCGR